jgi:hypothetical protein
MACNPILLASGTTLQDCCSSTTFTTFYSSGSSVELNLIFYSDSGCTTPVSNGYYTTNIHNSIFGQVDSGIGSLGEIILTGTCNDCGFTGTITETSFASCCNENYTFNVLHDIGVFSLDEVYFLETSVFSGCAKVIEYNVCRPLYCLYTATLEIDCDDCKTNNSIVCESYPCDNTCYYLDTGGLTNYDGQYCLVNQTYNSYDYFVGGDTTTRYLFYDGTKWCLSNTLGGSCLLFGNENCNTNCPDLCEELYVYVCTTTTTNACNIIDFDALFDCAPTQSPTPTPTVTPTITPTTTLTPTPTSTVLCYGTSITLSATTLPGESPTPTPTPSTTPPLRDNCFSGTATFDLIDDCFKCPDGNTICQPSNTPTPTHTPTTTPTQTPTLTIGLTQTPTQTPTKTSTPTPTPTPTMYGMSMCYSTISCEDACSC